MKLNDLKPRKPTLQEHLGLEWVFDLYETLKTRFDDEAWERIGKNEVGTATLGDETFRIVLEPGTFPIDGIKYRIINAAFQKIVDGKPTEELQLSGKNASKIVGAISNALLDRVQLFDFDGVIFIAKDHVEARMRLYNKVADRSWVQKGLGESIKDIDLGGGAMATALLSKELSRQKRDQFIEFVKSMKK